MFSIKKILFPTVFIFLLQLANYLKAEQLTIDVIGSSNNQIPIAISQFQNEENFKTVASKVILNDLKSTGLFAINSIENLNFPFDSTEIDFQTLADNTKAQEWLGWNPQGNLKKWIINYKKELGI